MKNIFRILALVLVSFTTYAQNTSFDVDKHFKEAGHSGLMILGTFHFNNPGLDSYKPEHEVDVLSDQKQKELTELINVIRKYAPTKISLYNEYLAGRFELRRNEVFQIGFRLAKLLGHKKVYAIDASAKRNNDLTGEGYKNKEKYYLQKTPKSLLEREMLLDQKFTQMYQFEDNLKTKISLLNYFLFINNPEIVKTSHGHYLISNFKMGEGNDYFGPDNAMWWYNRNLRIFHNLLQINEPGKDRIFLLIGAGHLPILDFLAETSVDFKKKDFKDFIKK